MSENQHIKKHNFDPFLIAKHTSYDQKESALKTIPFSATH